MAPGRLPRLGQIAEVNDQTDQCSVGVGQRGHRAAEQDLGRRNGTVDADRGPELQPLQDGRPLDILNRLQSNKLVDIQVLDTRAMKADTAESVDLKLVALAKELNGRLVTNDFNLSKIAKLREITHGDTNRPVQPLGDGKLPKNR
jgi:hypothetical protein